MSDLTREQIEALADGKFDVWRGSGEVDVCDALVPADKAIRALATEVLAQRDRRCGTCRHWADEDGNAGVAEAG